MFTYIKIDKFGTRFWFNENNQLHRFDGPAIITSVNKSWYVNGILHRIGGPAVEWYDGYKLWSVNGLLHRLDGPAIECEKYKYWFINNLKHREDGPAVEYMGDKEWWYCGKLIGSSGNDFTQEDFDNFLKELNKEKKC